MRLKPRLIQSATRHHLELIQNLLRVTGGLNDGMDVEKPDMGSQQNPIAEFTGLNQRLEDDLPLHTPQPVWTLKKSPLVKSLKLRTRG